MKTFLAYFVTFILATAIFTALLTMLLAFILGFLCFITWSLDISIAHPWLLARGLIALGAAIALTFLPSREAKECVQGFKDGWDRSRL